jgi:hypothetical protein
MPLFSIHSLEKKQSDKTSSSVPTRSKPAGKFWLTRAWHICLSCPCLFIYSRGSLSIRRSSLIHIWSFHSFALSLFTNNKTVSIFELTLFAPETPTDHQLLWSGAMSKSPRIVCFGLPARSPCHCSRGQWWWDGRLHRSAGSRNSYHSMSFLTSPKHSQSGEIHHGGLLPFPRNRCFICFWNIAMISAHSPDVNDKGFDIFQRVRRMSH